MRQQILIFLLFFFCKSIFAQNVEILGNAKITGKVEIMDTILFADGTELASACLTVLQDLDGDTKISVEQSADEDTIRFIVDGFEIAKFANNRLELEAQGHSVFIGYKSGNSDNGTDNYATAIGYRAGENQTDGFSNTYVGAYAGNANMNGSDNTYLGTSAGYKNTGLGNTLIGRRAGFENVSGINNTFVGNHAGSNNLGSGNVFLGNNSGQDESGSNKLIIDNSNTSTPLLYGDFDIDKLFINRTGGVSSAETFGIRTNTSDFGGMYIETNNDGASSFGKPFLGFAINGNQGSYLYHDGASDELRFYNNGNRLALQNNGALEINGAYSLPIIDGVAGQVLTTDGSGVSSWTSIQSGGGQFEDNAGTIRQISGFNQDFLFGRSTMPVNGQTAVGNFFFFDKNKAAFRGGTLSGNDFWSPDNTGTGSFAYGYDPFAGGNYAYSIGFGTVSRSLVETVMGSYNIVPTTFDAITWQPTDPIFTIGNGPNFVQRSNALTIYKNGNHKIGNSITSANYNLEINSENGNSEPFGVKVDGNLVLNIDNNGETSISAKNNDAILSMKSITDTGLNRSRVIVRQDNGEDVYMGDVDPNGGDVIIRANGSDVMMLDVNGKVGIGTDSPEQKLHIKGDANLESDGSGSPSFFAETSDGSKSKWMEFNNGTKNISIGALESSANNLILKSGDHKIQINETGKIEVGTVLETSVDTTTVNGVLHIKQKTFFPTSDPNKFDILAVTDKFGTRANLITSEENGSNNSILKIGDVDDKHDKVVFTSNGGNNIFIDETGWVGINNFVPGFQLDVLGDAGKSTGALWSITSDARLKKNIQDFNEGLDKILAIRPVTFQYNSKSGYDIEKEHIGVIAQELQEVAPYMVHEKENGYLDVNASALVYIFVNAIKELNAKLTLENKKYETLENEVNRLKEENQSRDQEFQLLLKKIEMLEQSIENI